MSGVKHVYFDVGGVLLLDYSGTNKWTEMKRDLGVTEAEDVAFDEVWKKYRNRMCIDFDVDTIITDLEMVLEKKFENYSMLDDFVNRFEFNVSIWPVAKATKDTYSVGLLTNMYPRMLDAIKAKKLIPDVEWDVVVDSSVVGHQKPDPGIFEVAEKLVKTEPSSIFFIDNSVENVEAAKARGWQALLYDPQNPEESSKKICEILNLSLE